MNNCIKRASFPTYNSLRLLHDSKPSRQHPVSQQQHQQQQQQVVQQQHQHSAPSNGSTMSYGCQYAHPQIDEAATKQSVRLSPSYLLQSGRSADGSSHLIRSAQYIQKELPVRIAHRVRDIRLLPYVVAVHPAIMAVQERYIRSFYALHRHPPVETLEQEAAFTRMLIDLLDGHKDAVQKLAEGFRASIRHLDASATRTFLDGILTSRLAIRLLAEHHVALHDTTKKHYVGIVCTNFSPKALLEKRYEFARKMCENRYGRCAEMRLRGDLADTFAYIPAPFEYIVGEVFKNSLRAVAERHADAASLPPISVTLVKNDVEFIIRVSDRGGGIRSDVREKIWQYGFTTDATAHPDAEASGSAAGNGHASAFGQLTQPDQPGTGQSVLSGYGFGLPMSAAFATYLGGHLSLETMSSHGTDVYLRLPLIDTDRESFRI